MSSKFTLSVAIVFTALVLVCNTPAQAGGRSRFKHADRNKDGTVDKKERKMEKKWQNKQKQKADLNKDGVVTPTEKKIHWKHNKSKVNTAVEVKYDRNGDGWLQPQEAKEFLKDKHTLIKTKGKAKVDSALEKQYDSNNDGIIDAKEADALAGDLK